ncbi:UDP-N-acetylmuramate dehydrogenase [Subtercola frigoramans]|uniref:UDP-N-acetylenolpyruvoylglucosamine reductase n=1 Tax=Subtercola frigoramans TaxID=120298 RepID=A0ABS2L1S3_9MICO|nr:UDP-N-acetylmuramate dehydrogenase [Subtercola frigoramans]MBM7471017.1 UDP-N-acetylmuramate dehydrogenase [Subtercola frigoramans]
MIEETTDTALAPLTTLRVGGVAARLVTASDRESLIEASLHAWHDGDEWMILGGGSNVVVSDDGFAGTVIRVASRGIIVTEAVPGDPPASVRLLVQAGEPWDDVVRYAVERGFSGIEALSGIPGSTGAAPIQNIGAYGQEIASSLTGVEFLDYDTEEVQWLGANELGFGYRTSVFKAGRRGVVLAVGLRLHVDAESSGSASASTATGAGPDSLGRPIEYGQLATALGVQPGDRVAVGLVRDAVLRLRASKGMILDASDPDSVSAGSFFTNPIVSEAFARTLPSDAPRWLVEPEAAPVVRALGEEPEPEVFSTHVTPPGGYPVKLSAAWLIEHAGIARGFAIPGSRAAISGKHTLALTNRGSATAAEIAELARFVQWRVQAEFGVNLSPEPVFVGFDAEQANDL